MLIPERDGLPDRQRSVGGVRALAFRVRGSQANWDGQRFSGLHQPVLYGAGAAVLGERLAGLGVSGDDSAKSLSRIMEMLLLGCGQIAVGSEHQTLALLKDRAFKDRIEVLPEPFMQAPGYMGVGKAFYVANQQVIERIWTTIGEIHASDQWRQLAPTLAQ